MLCVWCWFLLDCLLLFALLVLLCIVPFVWWFVILLVDSLLWFVMVLVLLIVLIWAFVVVMYINLDCILLGWDFGLLLVLCVGVWMICYFWGGWVVGRWMFVCAVCFRGFRL